MSVSSTLTLLAQLPGKMTGAIIASVPVVAMELSYLIIAMMDEEPTVVFGRSVSYVKVMGRPFAGMR